jgi:hypothetical protein
MKATIDFDERLYRRLKIEAARRGRTIRDLVDEGVRRVLDLSDENGGATASEAGAADPWFGSLSRYAANAQGEHDLTSMRRSIERARTRR